MSIYIDGRKWRYYGRQLSMHWSQKVSLQHRSKPYDLSGVRGKYSSEPRVSSNPTSKHGASTSVWLVLTLQRSRQYSIFLDWHQWIHRLPALKKNVEHFSLYFSSAFCKVFVTSPHSPDLHIESILLLRSSRSCFLLLAFQCVAHGFH